MKKTSAKPTRRARPAPDEIQPEYDWSKAVRNPYAARYAAGSNADGRVRKTGGRPLLCLASARPAPDPTMPLHIPKFWASVSGSARNTRDEDVALKCFGHGDRPIREEILREPRSPTDSLDGCPTRNGYGATVLNSAALLFADIDDVPVGLLGRLRRLFRSPRTP